MKQDCLSHIHYALLGLGDSNYTTFGGFPQALDKQLQKLGAKKIYSFVLADDAVGLEIVVDPWIENLWQALIRQESCTLPSSFAELKINDTSSPTEAANTVVPLLAQSNNCSPELQKPVQDTPSLETSLNFETCQPNAGSLTYSCEPLSKLNLKIPILSKPYLEINFLADDSNATVSECHCDLIDSILLTIFKFQIVPSHELYPPPITVPINHVKQLSSSDALKTALEINLDLSVIQLHYLTLNHFGYYATSCLVTGI